MANTMAMTQPYPVHGNMQPHPGHSHGHPMAQGQPHLGVQAQGMMPGMHGGPQVTQGGPMVSGMPPGTGVAAPGGPNHTAHAMAHLGSHPQMFPQHPPMPFQNNLQQHHQQILAQQRQRQQQSVHQQQQSQQQQQHPLQQQQHGGMMTMPNGHQLTPTQMARMGLTNTPLQFSMLQHQHQQHQQHQQQQQQHQQQQHQHQQQQHLQAQANPHSQAMQQHPNQLLVAQQRHQQQEEAQHQAVLQQRNTAAQLQMQENQAATGQPPQPQGVPARPQSAAAAQPPSQPPIPQQPTQPPPPTPQSQTQTHTPQQQPQPLPPQPGQSGPPQREPQPQQQAPPASQQQQQSQTPQQQQQQQQQQHSTQQHIQQQLQQQQQQQQQSQQQQLQEAQARHHHQQQQRNLMMQQPDVQKVMGGQVVLRLLNFIDRLSSPEPHQATKAAFWEDFVAQHFAPGGSLQHQLYNMTDGTDKKFRISYPALAYYYHSHFTSGIRTMTMQPQGAIERPLPMGCFAVLFPRCTFTHIFTNDVQVVSTGTLKVNFDANQKIEYLDIGTTKWVEYVPRLDLPMLEPPDMKSPKVNKNTKKAQPRPVQAQAAVQVQAPTMVNSNGITNGVLQNLEIAEALTLMEPLFQYSQNHDHLTPAEALNSLVLETARAQNPVGALPSGGFNNAGPAGVAGQRTPGLSGPNQFASPAMQNLGLPAQGSPRIGGPAHTPSPANMHMAGPVAMVHQHSQQGSNLSGSQGASANTSPNMTNKRRRASAIKLEEDGGHEVNGVAGNKVKPSPRLSGKRQKGPT